MQTVSLGHGKGEGLGLGDGLGDGEGDGDGLGEGPGTITSMVWLHTSWLPMEPVMYPSLT